MSDSTSVSADSIRAASDARLAQGFYGGRPHMGTGTLEGHQGQDWTPQATTQYARRCADTAARPSAPPHVRCRGGRLALAPRVLCGSRHVAQFSLVSTVLPSSLRPAQACRFSSHHETFQSHNQSSAGKLLAKGAGRWERNLLYPLCSARRRCAGDASELCGEVCWKFSCMLCHHDQVEWCVIERRGHCVTLRRRVSTSRLGPKRGGVAVC